MSFEEEVLTPMMTFFQRNALWIALITLGVCALFFMLAGML
jgi:hypothetical protein